MGNSGLDDPVDAVWSPGKLINTACGYSQDS